MAEEPLNRYDREINNLATEVRSLKESIWPEFRKINEWMERTRVHIGTQIGFDGNHGAIQRMILGDTKRLDLLEEQFRGGPMLKGVFERLRDLEQFQTEQDEAVKETKRYFWGTISALFGSLVLFLVNYFYSHH